MRRFAVGCFAVALLAAPVHAQILKQEPPMGKLKPGETVRVDNGKCPSGQIMQVTGGDHRKVGGKQLIERSRRCVPR
jgi:hypothetical protein